MTPENWQRVEELFHAALGCPPTERIRLLDQSCAGDEQLRAEVESLLAAHENHAPLLEHPPSDLAAELLTAHQPARVLMTGRTLGKYKVAECIGAGGMGEVYRARDLTLDRDVALKILPQGSSSDSMRRFAVEAKAASSINHPNIATVYEIGESDGLVFIAMELVEGQTLAAVHKPVAPEVLIQWAVQIADALAAAHAQGITHRDVKPGNIMIAGGRIKVLDFGLAKPANQDGAHTATGIIIGTVQYMSPEQLHGTGVDHRTDLFSFGAVLFELATGVSPFLGAVAPETIARILNAPPATAGSTIPPALRAIVYRCLEKVPERRYPTARALWRELSTLDSNQRPASRRGWITGTAAAALVAAAGIGWLRRTSSSNRNIRSLAVLPLANLSGQPDQDFFSDGMTEALTSALARIRQLRVISRSSAMQYRDTRLSLPEIARNLGVDAVIEGSIVRSGGRVRVTVQLIDAATDTHLWSKDYERDAKDVIEIQREVAREVAREIHLQIYPTTATAVPPQAHERYLRGRYHWNRRTGADLRQAIEYFQGAIQEAPDYAAAHVGLADSYLLLSPYAGLPPSQTYPKAEASARRALEIDKSSGEAHATMGVIEHEYNWNHNAARAHFESALDLEPNYAPARQWYAEFLIRLRQPEKALAQIRVAQQLDPLSLIVRAVTGWVLHFAGRHSDAIAQLLDTLQLDPRFVPARGYLGMAFSAAGRHDEAVREFQTALEISNGNSRYLSSLGVALARAGRTTEAHAKLAELHTRMARSPFPAGQIAAVLVALNQDDEAWKWLERAAGERGVWMLFLNFDPLYDRLRPLPRFQSLLRQAGLPV